MVTKRFDSIYIFAILIGILMFVASIGGLFVDGLYRDEAEFVLNGWYANDFVSLVVAVPALFAAFPFANKGSFKAKLLLLGVFNYTLYNFSFYLFGAALNIFFPIYIALFILAMYGLIFGLVNVDVNLVGESWKGKSIFKWISGFMIFTGFVLTVAWIAQWLNFVITGKVPQILADVGSTVYLVAALDLTFVVPAFTLGAIWLLQGKIWGYVIAIIMNIKGLIYNIVLTAGSLFQEYNGIEGAAALVPLWLVLGIGCLLSIFILFKNIGGKEKIVIPDLRKVNVQ